MSGIQYPDELPCRACSAEIEETLILHRYIDEMKKF